MVLKIDYGKPKFQRVTYDVIFKTSQRLRTKICHQNDVIKIFHVQAPPFAKFWLRSWIFLHGYDETFCCFQWKTFVKSSNDRNKIVFESNFSFFNCSVQKL